MILHGSATWIVFTTCYNSSFSSARNIFRYIYKMKHMKTYSDLHWNLQDLFKMYLVTSLEKEMVLARGCD